MPFMPIFGSKYIGVTSSGLSAISSAGECYLEHTESGSGRGSGSMRIRKKTELTIREELQKETDEWLGDMV